MSMAKKHRQIAFKTILLILCLSILCSTLFVAMMLFNRIYAIADGMQKSIRTYSTIANLSESIKEAEDAYSDFFLNFSGTEETQALSNGLGNIHQHLSRARLEVNSVMVPYEKNQQQYYLAKGITNGIIYLDAYIDILAKGTFPLQTEERFSSFYWGTKIFSYLKNYSNNQLLSLAVNSDVIASAKNMQLMTNLQQLSLIAMLLMAIISVIASFLVTQYLTNPLKNMVDTASDITKGNLDTKDLSLQGPQELVFLEDSMNQMKSSLKDRLALEKQLYNHQLGQEKMNRELERARFLSLQSQINPHFLFNTLNTISHTALFEKADDTVELINTLSGFLRYTLEYKESVTLFTEMEFVKQYLALQQARFKDRVFSLLSCDKEVASLLVPPLIIQPFVENAIKHGLEPLEKGGMVTVTAKKKGERAQIIIEDTGVGIPSAFSIEELHTDDKHIGISNVRDRLSFYYQGRARLEMNRISDEGGTRVSILLPLNAEEA